ncbi:MAG TPA: PfkB family carbohydrate kinase, partial [Thermomicrobiales bacterium]|nr:PfkB family carbohydrate kinase [Thermomicrobiales bacterium]
LAVADGPSERRCGHATHTGVESMERMTASHSGRVPDYVAIGHMTIDRTPSGDMLGGSVLYAALTAARYGLRAAILTRANLAALDGQQRRQLDEIAAEVEIVTQASNGITTFTNTEVAGRRSQQIHDWGGEIDLTGLPPLWRSAGAIHLAPVAQEIEPRQVSRLSPRLLGCTPQGWMRRWDEERLGKVRAVPLRLPADLISRIDALVVSAEEYTHSRDIVVQVGERGLSAITRGMQGASLIDRGREVDIPAYRIKVVDTTGAGDVFAAALFAARSERQSVSASARYASAAAALNVSGDGLSSVPRRAEVEALIDRS